MAVAAAAAAPTQVRRWLGLGPRTRTPPPPSPTLLLLLLLLAPLLLAPAASATPAAPRAQSAAAPTPAAGPSSHPAAQPTPTRAHHGGATATGANEGNNRRTTPVTPSPTQRNPPRTTGSTPNGRGDIVFPDSQYKPRFNGNRPNCARGSATFCEDGVEGYPMEHLNQVLGNTVGIRGYFGNDTIDENLADRFGNNGEKSICLSEEKIVFPKMGQNADGQWAFIVNLDNNFQQGIRVELCSNKDQPCLFATAFPDGSNAVCRQKYIYRTMMAVGDSGEAQPDAFKIPSCCACHVNSEVTSRILRPNEPPVTKRRRRRHNVMVPFQ